MLATWWLNFKLYMKKLILILLTSAIIYSCSKTESTPTPTPPVVIKLSSCDSIKQGLLKTTSDTIRLVSCLSITGCDSVRLGILKPNSQDTLRLLSCIKITGCDSVRLGVLKPNTQDTLRLLTCIKISGCDSVRLGLLKSTKDLLRLNCNSLSITIGTQKWMIVNLDIETYRNGDIIPQVTDPTVWATLTTGAWCYQNNDAANGVKFGKLYNWYAVNDSRGLVPQGWHIPTDAEWQTLRTFLGGSAVAGGKLKEVGTLNWKSPNANATNETGFSGLPGGNRGDNGNFGDLGLYGFWWSASQSNFTYVWSYFMNANSGSLERYSYNKKFGFSVRCIKD